jgi:transposase-like protein
MLKSKRKRYLPEFKDKVAKEALEWGVALVQSVVMFDVYPNFVAQWKKHILKGL